MQITELGDLARIGSNIIDIDSKGFASNSQKNVNIEPSSNKAYLEKIIDSYFDYFGNITNNDNYFMGDIIAGGLLLIISIVVSGIIYFISQNFDITIWGIISIIFIFFDVFTIILLRSHYRSYRKLYNLDIFPLNEGSKTAKMLNKRSLNKEYTDFIPLNPLYKGHSISFASLLGLFMSFLFISLFVIMFIVIFFSSLAFLSFIVLYYISHNPSSNLTETASNMRISYTNSLPIGAFVLLGVFTTFIIGNLISVFLDTVFSVCYISFKCKIKIDFMDELGGTTIFGKLILRSLYLATLVSLLLPTVQVLFDVIKAKVPLSISNIIPAIQSNQMDYISYFLYYFAFLIFLSLILLTIFSLHEQLKKGKEQELTKIKSKINLHDYNGNSEADRQTEHLLIIYDRINSMKEWPFKLDFIIYIIISILIPIITLYFQMFPP